MHDEIEDAEKKKGSQAGGCQRVNRLVDDQKPVCSQLFEVFFLLVLPQKVMKMAIPTKKVKVGIKIFIYFLVFLVEILQFSSHRTL